MVSVWPKNLSSRDIGFGVVSPLNLSPCFTSLGVTPNFSGVGFGVGVFFPCTLSDKGAVLNVEGSTRGLSLNGVGWGFLNLDKSDFKSFNAISIFSYYLLHFVFLWFH